MEINLLIIARWHSDEIARAVYAAIIYAALLSRESIYTVRIFLLLYMLAHVPWVNKYPYVVFFLLTSR